MPSPEPCPNDKKIYLPIDVLTAARRRINLVFDRFETVVVSISGGKDSQVTFELAHAEAIARGRELHVFFLDQEAEYQSSIDVAREALTRPGVVPHWYQVPLRMTNATSYDAPFLHAWGEGETWVREKDPLAIHEPHDGCPDRFYAFMEWFEAHMSGACFLVGLRSEESLNRFGAVTRNPAIEGMNWTSRGAGDSVRAYPIYDWAYEDVWTYLGREGLRYNRVYDWLYAKGANINEMRVSFLLHEHSFKSMVTLQEFEPDTYQRVIDRIGGAHVAALYAKERTFRADSLPDRFGTWLEYRNFLLDEIDTDGAFAKRFAKQHDSGRNHKQQVRQLLINDRENNAPVINQPDQPNPLDKWMEIL